MLLLTIRINITPIVSPFIDFVIERVHDTSKALKLDKGIWGGIVVLSDFPRAVIHIACNIHHLMAANRCAIA
jgi:hypothetical protein